MRLFGAFEITRSVGHCNFASPTLRTMILFPTFLAVHTPKRKLLARAKCRNFSTGVALTEPRSYTRVSLYARLVSYEKKLGSIAHAPERLGAIHHYARATVNDSRDDQPDRGFSEC